MRTHTQVLYSYLLGVLLLKERFSVLSLVGSLLIALGVMGVSFKPKAAAGSTQHAYAPVATTDEPASPPSVRASPGGTEGSAKDGVAGGAGVLHEAGGGAAAQPGAAAAGGAGPTGGPWGEVQAAEGHGQGKGGAAHANGAAHASGPPPAVELTQLSTGAGAGEARARSARPSGEGVPVSLVPRPSLPGAGWGAPPHVVLQPLELQAGHGVHPAAPLYTGPGDGGEAGQGAWEGGAWEAGAEHGGVQDGAWLLGPEAQEAGALMLQGSLSGALWGHGGGSGRASGDGVASLPGDHVGWGGGETGAGAAQYAGNGRGSDGGSGARDGPRTGDSEQPE